MYRTKRGIISAALAHATGLSDPPLTDGGEHADFASTAPFALARERRKAPAIIAAEIRDVLRQDPTLAGITVSCAGPWPPAPSSSFRRAAATSSDV